MAKTALSASPLRLRWRLLRLMPTLAEAGFLLVHASVAGVDHLFTAIAGALSLLTGIVQAISKEMASQNAAGVTTLTFSIKY
jgi:hypothetical protein